MVHAYFCFHQNYCNSRTCVIWVFTLDLWGCQHGAQLSVERRYLSTINNFLGFSGLVHSL